MSRSLYRHPLVYVVGLEGLALLHAFSGLYDRAFTLARFHELRDLLDAELGDSVEATPMETSEVYERWGSFYDEPGNELIDIEEPIVREILDGLPLGVGIDAACGTGSHAQYLISLGHR